MVHPEVQGIRWLGSRIKHSEVKAIHRDCVLFFFFLLQRFNVRRMLDTERCEA